MDWFKPSLFAIVLLSVLVTECCCRNSSYFEVVQRYEQCVLNRLPRSHIFAEEDKLHMVKVANEVNHRMHLYHLDPTDAPHARSMLRLFSSVLAKVIADGDVAENPQRQDAYIAVIETCSSALPRPVAEKLLQDVKGIFASMGNEKIDTNEAPVLSRRRGMLAESEASDDNAPIHRSKRSPQAVAFSTFGEWKPTESLQTVLSNILLNSNAFLNVFKGGISRRDAIYYARSMAEAGLVNYHFSVVQEVVNSISNTIASFPFNPEPRNYAFAISSSIASVLDARQLSFFADGVGIGNGLVSKLQMMLDNKAPAASFPITSGSSASSFSWGTSSSSSQRTMPNSQMSFSFVQPQQPPSPVFTSPQRSAEEFESDLAFFLYQSDKMQGAFCNGPFQEIFDMVNGGLSEYELSISLTAASIINDSLTSMGSDLACAQFGNVISETVTNLLKNNNLLENANAQDIAEKMASNLNPRQDFKEPPTQNQGSQVYSSSQQEPPFFSEFSFPETQQPARNPDFQFDQPQNPSFGVLPVNPMVKTEDYPQTGEFSYDTSGSAQVPSQGTQMSEEYPQFNPGSESAVSGDYSGDVSGTSGTDTAGEQSSISRSDESGDQKFETAEDSSSVNNPQISSDASAPLDSGMPQEAGPNNPQISFDASSPLDSGIPQEASPNNPQISSDASAPLDSGMPQEAGPNNPPDTTATAQSKANAQTVNNGAPTTSSLNRTGFAENGDTQTRTTVNIITTTTPYPVTTTSLDGGKVAKIVLDDIYESLRALNSSSGDDTKPQTDSSDVVEKKGNPSESSTIQDSDSIDKVEPEAIKLTTMAAEESRLKQETPVALEPSFWPTASPSTGEGSSVGEFRNETQSSEAPEEELQLRDPRLVFAEHVTSIATSSIGYIRSGNVDLEELCKMMNELAPVVDIPPLDVCDKIAAMDYLLNVLRVVVRILSGV